ncbi:MULTISPECIES: hypothetical protein [Streptomycetaceae]|uniref:hypothetical protein n=1 Tax=Streptomycetaceae TaxID=2062 RepID=UPI0009397BCC|nr:hypothetical protein [Streptomyces sp. CB02056]OKI07044.1 hypothetical protein AMK13_16935 [Streptomyces sp. CB02056]
MHSREQPQKAGQPQRDASPARRPGTGARSEGDAPARGAAALQRTVGNAATARMIAEQRDGTGRDDRRAAVGLQRAPGDQAAPRRPRVQLDQNNVLRICEAATPDGQAASGGRAADLRNIVWEDHWAAISEVCRKHKYTIAVRETGEHSIRRIAEGAKPKPHTILEKSIKPSSVRKKYGTGPGQAEGDPATVLRWLQAQDLSGFVGHWNEQGLAGIRIDRPPQSVLDLGIVQTGPGGEQYVPIDLRTQDGGPALTQLKADPHWKRYLYTGDYDLHEVYSAQGGTGGGQIPEATPEKAKLLDRLNAGIAGTAQEGEVVRSGKVAMEHGRLHMAGGSEYAMFQHGDQATYRMNQYLEALEGEVARHAAQLVRAVATEADEPLAWCRMGQWYVTRNREEHAVLRARWKLAVPHTWGADEVDRTARGGYRTAGYID